MVSDDEVGVVMLTAVIDLFILVAVSCPVGGDGRVGVVPSRNAAW